MRSAPRGGAIAFTAALLCAAGPAPAQDPVPVDRTWVPASPGPGFDGRYPARLLTVETARLLEGGRGHVGFGDTRYAVLDRRLEVITNTISDLFGVGMISAKLGILDPDERTVGLAIGGKAYYSYGGLIDTGVAKVAESFAEVTDSEVDVSGWIVFGTASWSAADDLTHLHLGVQVHQPIENRFEVVDSVAGGGGSVEFLDGEDLSVMWGVDHQILGRTLVGMLEAGWSFTLEQARLGAAVDAGSERWRFMFGLMLPGVETDLATDATDFVVTPTLSIHYRFGGGR
ncbi:MAG TPA: hypothetical protein VM778_10240 [Gemmatimonadota bacterium]|nr:hypothetical protein [Gemmatimonadota bacterium]